MAMKSLPRILAHRTCVEPRCYRPSLKQCLQTTVSRDYATQNPFGGQVSSSRKQVTVTSDDGKVDWRDLSVREKAARTTQQTFNFGVILIGFLMTGGVIYYLYTGVFSSESKVAHFNRAVDKVRADPRATDILGNKGKIRAFGEPTSNKWARARPIASTLRKDGTGTEHWLMHFYVEGSSRSGVVNVHLIKRPGQTEFEYKYLALDVKGHERIYLENADVVQKAKQSSLRTFGVNWR
ncbi:mitochondrial import inner membrane translocase subunit tim21 [Pseudocyphellaria aurata]|nr:mitochondrial import inner membrane translocase subunit tim21 [Pseudocyphellaria aurata]